MARFVPPNVDTLFEPFAGSAAFSLYAAKHGFARHFVIGDALIPLIDLWKMIVTDPGYVSDAYQRLWVGQQGADTFYFNQVREQYNQKQDPVMLLYLIVRCVKNAVRFNKNGLFTQSVDKRRKGMHPDKMRAAIYGASKLLTGRVEFYAGDFRGCLASAQRNDLVYMDPPYQGTTYGRDKRYYQQLEVERLCVVLDSLNLRGVPFLLSYDGKHGDKEYGEPLPERLGMQQFLINSGRSSQATLNGRNTVTFEGLYVSQGLARPGMPRVLELDPVEQLSLQF